MCKNPTHWNIFIRSFENYNSTSKGTDLNKVLFYSINSTKTKRQNDGAFHLILKTSPKLTVDRNRMGLYRWISLFNRHKNCRIYSSLT